MDKGKEGLSKDQPNEFTLAEEDIHRAFHAMGAVNPCPICGHGTWNILRGEHDYPAIVMMGNPQRLGFQVPNIPVTMLFCGNCFFLRVHPTKALMQWLEQNPKKDGDEGSAGDDA